MEDKKELKEIMQESKRLYDEQCKKILSYKQILSYLFQSCLEEYKDLSLEEIQELLEKETESEMRKMCTFSDAIWKKGIEKGRDEGMERGIKEGSLIISINNVQNLFIKTCCFQHRRSHGFIRSRSIFTTGYFKIYTDALEIDWNI